MEQQDYPAPEHLSDRAKALWLDLVPRRARSAGRLVMLTAALEALDRAEQARTAIATAGLTTTTSTTKAIHINPAVRVERESKQLFAKLWDQLGFSFEHRVDGYKP